MIGLTLKYKTLAGTAQGTPEGELIAAYGGLDKAFDSLYAQGIRSVEISMLDSSLPDEVTLAMIDRIYDHGLLLSIHGVLEDMSGSDYLSRFDLVFGKVMKMQDSLNVTLHGNVDIGYQNRVIDDWAKTASGVWPFLTFAIENQRVRNCRYEHEKDHYRINTLPAQLSDTKNTGICWDMGHYGYNTVNLGLPVETLPGPEALGRIIHTHIHCLKDMDTHHPIVAHPIKEYVDALKSVDYKGIYNIEVKADKYISYMDVREGMESSIAVLKEIIG